MNDEEPLYIKLEDVDRHENGDVTYRFDMDEQAAKCAAQEGMKLFLYCGVSRVDLQDVYDWILSQAEGVGE